MKVVELVLDEEQENFVEAISVVEFPAIEEDFVALKSQEFKFAEQDTDKKILIGPVLIPNKPIYRKNAEEEYYIYFNRDTVRRASHLYLKQGNQSNSTLEHAEKINGLTLVESWIVEDKSNDKSNAYGMDVPLGTWMGSVKVDNDEIWNDYVKTGKVKGFSIEGYFADKADLRETEEDFAKEVLEELKNALEGVELETYNDYPKAAVENAKRAIKYKEEKGTSCGTNIGWTRAGQLSRMEKISRSTIARMASFKRHQQNKDVPYDEGCGGIMWDAWGGTEGIEWAIRKLDEIDKKKLAEIGPRGGVKKSPKAPKSSTPNKNPKGEGTAKGDASTGRGAKVSKKDEASLQKKADEFNERYKEKLGYGVTVGQLKAVFQRGLGAFNTSHSPNVKSPSQWAHARVNAYLYLVKNGRPENAKYTTDYDLLPKKHPKSPK